MASEVQVETSPVGPVVRPPGGTEPVVLYLHGDRHLSCTPEAALDLAGRLALWTDAVVVCARYGAPSRTRWTTARRVRLLRVQGTGGGGGRAVGAGLAAALLVRLRDLGAPPPCAGC
ncbi:hypothetical protein O1M63_01445 [Streptomyces mirabilis]|nr:hypothetical protein [Streptomyces mirabilis]